MPKHKSQTSKKAVGGSLRHSLKVEMHSKHDVQTPEYQDQDLVVDSDQGRDQEAEYQDQDLVVDSDQGRDQEAEYQDQDLVVDSDQGRDQEAVEAATKPSDDFKVVSKDNSQDEVKSSAAQSLETTLKISDVRHSNISDLAPAPSISFKLSQPDLIWQNISRGVYFEDEDTSSDSSTSSSHSITSESTNGLSDSIEKRSTNGIESSSSQPKASPIKKEDTFSLEIEDSESETSYLSIDHSEEAPDDIFKRSKMIISLAMRNLPDIDQLSESSWVPRQDEKVEKEEKEEEVEEEYFASGSWETAFDDFSKSNQQTDSISTHTLDMVEVSSDVQLSDSNVKSGISLNSEGFLPSLGSSEMRTAIPQPPQELDIFKNLMKSQAHDSSEDIAVAREIQEIKCICDYFLNEVINGVVAHCNDAKVQLLKNLDKEKMLKKLHELHEETTEEIKTNDELKQLVVNYFIRKREFSKITAPKLFDKFNYQYFHQNLSKLDALLKGEQELIKKSQPKVDEARQELQTASARSAERVLYLERLMRDTLIRSEKFTHLAMVLDKEHASMARLREEVSVQRRRLLLAQHRVAGLEIKLEKLANIGEFLDKQSENELLQVKIIERDNDVNQMRTKFNFKTHMLSHYRSKAFILKRELEKKRSKLKKLEQTKSQLRSRVCQGRLTHNILLKSLQKEKNTGGIMFYPRLMKDFDITVKASHLQRAIVERLRQVYADLQRRIHRVERSSDLANESNLQTTLQRSTLQVVR